MKFAYERAESLGQALELQGGKPGACFLAGGTNLLLRIKHRRLKPSHVISIARLKELVFIREEGGYIRIGAGVKINDLIASGLLNDKAPLLIRAAGEIGSEEVRNMATIGGNICSVGANCGACGVPGCGSLSGGGVKACHYASSADLIPPLLALDAGLVLAGAQGDRHVMLRDFLPGARKTGIKPGEILKEIQIRPREGGGWGYARLATARAMGITVVSAAAVLYHGPDGTCRDLSLAVGGSFEKPVKVEGIDQMAGGRKLDQETIERIISAAGRQLSYSMNLKMSEDYRRHMTGILIRQAIEQAQGAER